MAGNVWEWTAPWLPGDAAYVVGGSYNSLPREVLLAATIGHMPSEVEPQRRQSHSSGRLSDPPEEAALLPGLTP